MKDIDRALSTARKLVEAMKRREISAEELTSLYLARIERYGGKDSLNAVAEVDESSLAQARALDHLSAGERLNLSLLGLPILIKDNIDVRGLHTTAGSLALNDNIARRDAPVIARLRKAGAVILGKANMTEFANYTSTKMPNGFSARGGQVKCAYGASLNPSGSSTGSAAAVSEGLCAAAIGTDTSFSIIACATVHGVTGLKPPHGALPQSGIVPIAPTLDSAGPLTRDLSDALLIYNAMRGKEAPFLPPLPPPEIRIKINTFNRDAVSDRQLKLYDGVLAKLRRAGVQIGETSHPYSPYLKTIMRAEFRPALEHYLASAQAPVKTLNEIAALYALHPEEMAPYGYDLLTGALDFDDPEEYAKALAERKRLRRSLLRDLRDCDACLMTGPTSVMHLTGLPSLALKLGMGEDGAPRGMILYGADEERLFRAALTIETFCVPVIPPELEAFA